MIYYSGDPVHQSQYSLVPLQDLPDEINTKHSIIP